MSVTLLTNISDLLTLESAYNKDGRNLSRDDFETISNASIAYNPEKILWVGRTEDTPEEYKSLKSHNMAGISITPEIVDSHTHIVFAGNRSKEYTLRLNGADYEEIAKAGGGILNTMNATNNASETELFDLAVERVERLYSYGIGTIEIKSGYGLTYESEKMISNVIAKLKDHFSPRVQIFNTYLAAHAVPKTFSSSAQYLDEVVIPLLKELASQSIIDAVDIFHESGYFNAEDTKRLFSISKDLNIPRKIHADEFNDNKGAKIACEFEALSADHLLCTTEDGIQALAQSKTVATLLPGTGFFLGKPQAKAKEFLDKGCKVALASDYNPGSCHFDNLLQVAAFAAPHYKLNAAQLWSSITLNAAHALDKKDQGAIVEGLKPRFSFFKCNSVDEITYSWGRNLAVKKEDLLN